MTQRFEVEMLIESGGKPEDDQRVTKIVDAVDDRAAVDAARQKVRDENPDVNHMKIWYWNTRRLYT